MTKSKMANQYSPKVRARAVRMVIEHQSSCETQVGGIAAIAAKIGCIPQTPREWMIGFLLLASIAQRICDYISKNLSDAIERARECLNCECPECIPPRGTVGIQVHWCPPGRPHAPYPSHHVHFLIQQQNPNNCRCFWDRNARRVLCPDPNDTPVKFDPKE